MPSVDASTPQSNLIALSDAALWTSRAWPDLANLPDRVLRSALVVLPVFGLSDWGLGRPLDVEETLGTAILREAIQTHSLPRERLLMLPPLRFALAPYPHSVFGVDFETGLDMLLEVGTSIKAAGFRKLVMFATSPWNEEYVDVGGRTLRVHLGIQAFQISLAGLGVDLHPTRSSRRDAAQHLACACYRSAPEEDASPEDVALPEFRPGNIRQPGPARLELPLEDAIALGEGILRTASRRMASLWKEIADRPALVDDGRPPKIKPTARQKRTAREKRKRTG